jgi:Ca2+-binding RTX toxin-like protein
VGWFEISGYDLDLTDVEPPEFSPLTVELALSNGLGRGLTELLKQAAAGTVFDGIKIDGVTVGAHPGLTVFELTLGEVQILNVDEGSAVPDKLTFNYEKIWVDTTEQNADGSTGAKESFSYDLVQSLPEAGPRPDLDPNSAAPIITSNGGNDLAVSVAENTYFVTKVIATDADADPLTFELSGADAALFKVAANGDITFLATPDFELPNSFDGDNVYELVVTVLDTSFASDTQAITVTVSDVVEIVDTGGGASMQGTGGPDTFIPGDGKDNVHAGDGDDVIKATANDGKDNYHGGNGSDTVDYSALTAAVTVSLGQLFGRGQGGGKTTGSQSDTDILQSIENVIGSAAGDQISGNGFANIFDGRGGNDVMTGGGDNDTHVFRPGFGLDQITDFDDSGDDTIVFSTAVLANWMAVQNAMTASGNDVVITFDSANKVTLLGTALSSMTESDFAFVP